MVAHVAVSTVYSWILLFDVRDSRLDPLNVLLGLLLRQLSTCRSDWAWVLGVEEVWFDIRITDVSPS